MPCPLTVALLFLKPGFARTGTDRLEPLTVKRMRSPRNAGGYDVMSSKRSTWQLLPPWLKQLECEQWKHWGSLKQPAMRKKRLRLVGLLVDERGMPREDVGDKTLSEEETSELVTTAGGGSDKSPNP